MAHFTHASGWHSVHTSRQLRGGGAVPDIQWSSLALATPGGLQGTVPTIQWFSLRLLIRVAHSTADDEAELESLSDASRLAFLRFVFSSPPVRPFCFLSLFKSLAHNAIVIVIDVSTHNAIVIVTNAVHNWTSFGNAGREGLGVGFGVGCVGPSLAFTISGS